MFWENYEGYGMMNNIWTGESLDKFTITNMQLEFC